MPGKKDFVSVKLKGKRVHVQKWLVLNNLREVCRVFKEKSSDKKIGFSKFAGWSQWYSLGMCMHNTSKCKIDDACNAAIRSTNILPLLSKRITYNPPLPKCYLDECDVCPGVVKLKEELACHSPG